MRTRPAGGGRPTWYITGASRGFDVLVDNTGQGLLGALGESSDADPRSLSGLVVFRLIKVSRAVMLRRSRDDLAPWRTKSAATVHDDAARWSSAS
ncbi:hypothetical protein [Streptomyces sp. MI02-7b]|uniref:hypothetical protein n=1 Tax=Streptomyces sp. MI02-7b TaxID=462941 RepID=UPI0029BB1C8F|nr:hypothetical protein [Streptomyces sp. MI02-7b]MDX3075450.1 hypothetical protein [Streptomyces sp. MI02-7b]